MRIPNGTAIMLAQKASIIRPIKQTTPAKPRHQPGGVVDSRLCPSDVGLTLVRRVSERRLISPPLVGPVTHRPLAEMLLK
jgi:hypothetical protein